MSKYRRHSDTVLDVSSRYSCYGNLAAGPKPIYKFFSIVNWEVNKVHLYQT